MDFKMTDYAELPYTVQQSGTIPVITQHPAYAWRCQECGWLGVGLGSETAATKEAAKHTWEEHKIVPCRPERFGDPHKFQHVKGTDSISKCDRCEWEIGK
jgi:hypothetical protein